LFFFNWTINWIWFVLVQGKHSFLLNISKCFYFYAFPHFFLIPNSKPNNRPSNIYTYYTLNNRLGQWWAAKFLTRGSLLKKKSKKNLLIFSYINFFFNKNRSKLHLNFHLALFLLYFLLCYLLLITSKITVCAAY
jgi:hypothetical protein